MTHCIYSLPTLKSRSLPILNSGPQKHTIMHKWALRKKLKMSKTSILVIFPVREIICFVHFSIKISWRLHSFPHRLTFSFKIILYFHLMSWNIDAIFVFLRWGNMVKKLEWRCDPIFSFFIFFRRGRAFTRRRWLKSLIVWERYLKGVNLLSHDYLKINRNNLYRPLIKPFKQYLTLLFWFQNNKIKLVSLYPS